jgi:hypothetical protein
MESGMSLMPHDLEVYQVQPLPIVKAYADKMGLVEAIDALVPTEMSWIRARWSSAWRHRAPRLSPSISAFPTTALDEEAPVSRRCAPEAAAERL